MILDGCVFQHLVITCLTLRGETHKSEVNKTPPLTNTDVPDNTWLRLLFCSKKTAKDFGRNYFYISSFTQIFSPWTRRRGTFW